MTLLKLIPVGAAALALAAMAVVTTSEPPACESVEGCIALVRNVPQRSNGLNETEHAIAERLRSFGEDAVPALVGHLGDGDRDVRKVSAYTLRDIDGIDRKFLPDLEQAMRNGNGWIAPAIGRMQTDEAAKVLAQELFRNPAKHTQLTYALEIMGGKAIPHLVAQAGCVEECSAYLSAVAHVFTSLDVVDEVAVRDLLENASNASLPDAVRAGNVRLIGALGPGSTTAEHGLLVLGERSPELQDAVVGALHDIKSPQVARFLARKLRSEPSVILLRDIAELGEAGRLLGPTIVSLFAHDDWDVRVHARYALGFIGYAEAVPDLVASLDDVEDWRRVWAAIQSLGRLGDDRAIPALEEVRGRHWYPKVAEAAEQAISVIEGSETYRAITRNDNFAWQYFLPLDQASKVKTCGATKIARVPELRARKLYPDHAATKLAELAYPIEVAGYEQDDDSGSLIEKIEVKQAEPQVALRLDDGWLLGRDIGEWGGETVFMDDKGEHVILLKENTEDIYRLGDDHVAVTGLAHMTFNRGRLYRLARSESGAWEVYPWRQLPGAPASSWFVQTGELLVNAFGNARVLIDADGNMRMACGVKR